MNPKENSLTHVIFNILIPVMILNQGHKVGLTPQHVLLIALSFPLFFTLKSLIQSRKINFVSLLGLLNVLVSGTLSLLALGGMWFAVKEAAFPLLIGIFVLASTWTRKPFFQGIFMNPEIFDMAKLEAQLPTDEKKASFLNLMKRATLLLSISFLMSAILNFLLALRLFLPLADTLTPAEKQQLLNEQLGQMTLYSLGVILVPSILFLAGLFYYISKKIHELTGLKAEELILTK